MVALPANREKGRDRQWGQGLSHVGEMAAPTASEIRNSEEAVKYLRNPAGSEGDCSHLA